MRERGHDQAFRIRESSVYDTVTRPPAEAPAFAAPLMFIYSPGRDRALAAFQQRGTR